MSSTTSGSMRKRKSKARSSSARSSANVAGEVSVDVTQSDGDEEEEAFAVEDSLVRIASCSCTIVGIRYYQGTAHAGEYVSLVREPSNPYDSNAIRVDNMAGDKVGHIKKEQARIMAKFLDNAESRGLSLEGTIPSPGNQWTIPCNVEFFARAPAEELDRRALTLANQLQKAFRSQCSFQNHTESNDIAVVDAVETPPIVESKRLDWSAQAQKLDELFEQQTAQQLTGLPAVPMPSPLKTELLPYQKEGVKWMVHHDTTAKIPFYSEQKEKGNKVWHCSISNFSQVHKPNGFQGGILADMMGLGKTLQTIALILAAPPAKDEDPQCTLIVCPVSVMANWQQQIEQHLEEGVLKVEVYQGTNRAALLPQIMNGGIHILLVSYPTLSSDYTKFIGKSKEQHTKKRSHVDSIFSQKFHRIVLDEAHIIRNSRARMFQAVNEIQASRKWCLTGTPYVNRSEDIHSLLHFLGVEPLCDKKIFQRAITLPMQQGEDNGLACLRVAMAHVALRRSKASANINLVGKTVFLTKVSFPEKSPHKTVYDALFGSVRMAFQAVLQDGDQQALRNYSNIFEKLLRLRQACCSAHLVPVERRERAMELWKELQKRGDSSQPQLTAKEGLELLEKLKGTFCSIESPDELPECAVCLMEMEESQCVILKTCSHVYCEPCVRRVCADSYNPNCPLCRRPFTKKDMIKKTVASTAAEQEDPVDDVVINNNDMLGASPKIAALLETIKTSMRPDEKGVIFSQFTSFLDLIQAALKEAGQSYTRLDGSMNTNKRIQAIRAFSSEEEDSPRFILCSLHAAGTGINLTRGSVAFMMDCWWNTAVEDQAMDRIHRIGQSRPVSIHRFVMKDSLEERIVALQEVKSLQARGAMQKLKPEEKKKARLSDLKGLLLIDRDD